MTRVITLQNQNKISLNLKGISIKIYDNENEKK